MIVYASILEHQHSTVRKFSRRWFDLYKVGQDRDNGTDQLSELDGTLLQSPVAKKHVNISKKWEESYPYMDLEDDSDIGKGGTNREVKDQKITVMK